MQSLIFVFLAIAAAATASVVPSYGSSSPSGWTDYGTSKWSGGGYGGYKPAPVATSYANVWKVDHPSVPVVYKPVVAAPVVYKPVVKTYPNYGYAAWDTAPTYGGYGLDTQASQYGHY